MSLSGPVPTEQIRQLPTPELALRLLTAWRAVAERSVPTARCAGRSRRGQNGEGDVDFLLGQLADARAWLE
ncbi:MAG: TIGR02391 family protein, partial [Gemmatimonadota bacterium]|nr:TIGR02391 family protein [Gemmatimonadota bacterium]